MAEGLIRHHSSCGSVDQVGILTMAGKGVELLVSPTDDVGKLLGCLHSVKVRAAKHVQL